MSSKLQITPSESGPRLRSWTAWWAIAKASAHRCKREWHEAEDGAKATVLGLQSWSWDCSRSWTASEAMAKATREREGMDAGIGAKATVLDCMVGDCEGICASLQA